MLHSSGKSYTLEYQLSEHQIGDWRAASAAGLQGKGLSKRSVFSQTPVATQHQDLPHVHSYERCCLISHPPFTKSEGTKRATSVNVQLLRLQKDLHKCSISRDIVNFPSELCRRRRGHVYGSGTFGAA